MGLFRAVRRKAAPAAGLTLAFVLAIASAAHAAEVVAAEVEGDVNAVTVEQGGTSAFTISVTATGTIRCSATQANPATARFWTAFSVNDAGFTAQDELSDPLPFWANGFCRVTWPGALSPQTVAGRVTASAHAPLGTYMIRLRAVTSTPPGSGEQLLDQSNPFLRITVVEGSDNVPPVVDCSGPNGTQGANGWYTSAVTHACTAHDDGSGLADAGDAAFTLGTAGEGAQSTAARTVADARGNATDAGPFGPYDVDLNDPTVSIASPGNGAAYLLGSSQAASFGCDDSASGVASCEGGTIDTSTVGWHSFTVDATDNAGRAHSVTHTYQVVYDFAGLGFPGTGSPKAGSTLPLSFGLGGVDDLGAVDALSVTPCGGGSASMETPGSSGLRYDREHGVFRVNWKTDKAWAGGCATLAVGLDDGTSHPLTVWFR